MKKHIKLAILHEQRLIELRKQQINAYERRIMLMQQGLSYGKALKAVPPVSAQIDFDWKQYYKHKNSKSRDVLPKPMSNLGSIRGEN